MPSQILLCDDDRTSTLILKRMLEKAGLSVAVAQNGKEGVTMTLQLKPALLILDLDMPVKNGISVLEDLRAQGGGWSPRILVLSAHESPSDEAKVKSLGARDMVIKPFHPAEFLQKIQALLQEGGA